MGRSFDSTQMLFSSLKGTPFSLSFYVCWLLKVTKFYLCLPATILISDSVYSILSMPLAVAFVGGKREPEDQHPSFFAAVGTSCKKNMPQQVYQTQTPILTCGSLFPTRSISSMLFVLAFLSASQFFTRVFNLVSEWTHTKGIRLLRYLDDWLVVAESVCLLHPARVGLRQGCVMLPWLFTLYIDGVGREVNA